MKTETILKAIETAELNYLSNNSWQFKNNHVRHHLSIIFSKTEDGQNWIDEFCVKQNGDWIGLEPTIEQRELMFKILDYVEPIEEKYNDGFTVDDYFDNGVKREYFY